MKTYLLKVTGNREGPFPPNFTRLFVVERNCDGVTTTNDPKLAKHFESQIDALEYWTEFRVATHWKVRCVALDDC